MFRWPDSPSPNASEHELADFVELECWKRGAASITEILRAIGRLGENDYSMGVPEEEDGPVVVEGAYREIEQRKEACGDSYPFVIGRSGYSLSDDTQGRNIRGVIYRFLLLATRLNMRDYRVHANLDGTKVFERLAADTARNYFGERAESLVFGTSAGEGNFAGRINDLCRRIGEGGGLRLNAQHVQQQNDGRLDVAVWTPFRDGRAGKLIGFGQCKTGIRWRDHLTVLQSDSFCMKWFQSRPVHTPVRMFFVSEASRRSTWNNDAIDAGLLFDRCRVVDYSYDVNNTVFNEVSTWTKAAAAANGLPARW